MQDLCHHLLHSNHCSASTLYVIFLSHTQSAGGFLFDILHKNKHNMIANYKKSIVTNIHIIPLTVTKIDYITKFQIAIIGDF
jgi:hypothetical protein